MKMKLLSNIVGIITIGLFTAGTAYAHEPRIIGGDCHVEVGWQNEPALEDNDNFAILIIEECGGDTLVPADQINITIKALRLSTDAFDAQVKDQMVLGALETEDNFGKTQITPSRQGAYGFILNGTIAGRTIDNEKFVCGGGSQHPDEHFDCVVDPVVFPGPAIKRYIPHP